MVRGRRRRLRRTMVMILQVGGESRLSPADDEDRRTEGDEQTENDAVGKGATPKLQDVVFHPNTSAVL